ncbi:hypothetical protein ACL6C3_13415 [Capilliphycus salinus ALCB114379]|uniref:hypothetical protein n=1 Tax=Capilliphycus salinus TaxID=2768948 RepID=UPI0039A4984C
MSESNFSVSGKYNIEDSRRYMEQFIGLVLGDRSGHSVRKVARIDLGSVQTVVHGGTRTIVGTYSYMPHFLNCSILQNCSPS